MVQYREVKRVAKAGEKIKVVNARLTGGQYKNGDILTALKLSPFGTSLFTKESGVCLNHHEYVVLEPIVDTPESLEANIAAIEQQLADMKRQLAESKRLKVGDYAKVVDAGGSDKTKIGDIVQVKNILERPNYNDSLSEITILRSDSSAHVYLKRLVRATDEEVAEAKRKLAFDQFEEGEKVRLINGGGDYPLYGFKDGEIYEVKRARFDHSEGTKVQIVGEHGKSGYADPEQLAKLTEEDLQKIAEAEKWAKIGRKPGECKKGDIVRTVDAIGHPIGTIGVIERADGSEMPGVLANGKLYWHKVELIAPVEYLVNLRAEAV